MTPAAAEAYRLAEAASVQGPYIGLAVALVAAGRRDRAVQAAADRRGVGRRRRAGGRHATARAPGAIATWCSARSAIFVYVGGEVAIGSFLVNYFKEPAIGGLTEPRAPSSSRSTGAARWSGRFIGTVTLRMFKPGKVLAVHALAASRCWW